MARQSGKTPKQLEPIDAPECLLYLWRWFTELSGGRDYGEAGPKAITYSEIKSWAELTKTDPAAWEVETLKALDRAYLSEAMKK